MINQQRFAKRSLMKMETNKMKHKKEIERWADCPDGTCVWMKLDLSTWELILYPSWRIGATFIVDDDWAKVRKAKVDGKDIEMRYCSRWIPAKQGVNDFSGMNPEAYRVKPKEPVYEWQAYFKYCPSDVYRLTDHFYLQAWFDNDDSYTKFEPSKQEVKNDQL